jgi:hypothetical protein
MRTGLVAGLVLLNAGTLGAQEFRLSQLEPNQAARFRTRTSSTWVYGKISRHSADSLWFTDCSRCTAAAVSIVEISELEITRSSKSHAGAGFSIGVVTAALGSAAAGESHAGIGPSGKTNLVPLWAVLGGILGAAAGWLWRTPEWEYVDLTRTS